MIEYFATHLGRKSLPLNVGVLKEVDVRRLKAGDGGEVVEVSNGHVVASDELVALQHGVEHLQGFFHLFQLCFVGGGAAEHLGELWKHKLGIL